MARDEQFFVLIFVILVVDIASSLYISQQSTTRNVDETFMVICKDEAGQSVIWKGPKGILTERTRPSVQQGSYGSAIYFQKAKIQDTGNYTCILSSSPNERKVFSLKVEEELQFKNLEKLQTGAEGKSFTLKCQVNQPEARVTLSLPGKENMEGTYELVPEGIYFKNLSRKHAGVYQCLVVHKLTAVYISENITLNVHHVPSLPYNVFAEEEEVYAFLNETKNLTCEVEANPPPIFSWEDKGRGRVLNISDFISVLELNVTEDTPGTYQCTASNSEGALHKYFEVLLGEHPESPKNIKLVEAAPDSLQIKVEVDDIPLEIRDPVMDPQWIVVEYKPESEKEWFSEEFSITTESIILTGLSKKTKYEIRAATKNIAGLSWFYSNNTIFETSPATSIHPTTTPIVIYLSVLLVPMIWIA